MRLRQLFENIYETSDEEQEFDGALKTIGVCYGRWNPPHRGHRAVWEGASKNPIWYVGTNQNTEGPKDPLPYDVKLQCMAAVWPKVAGHVIPEQDLFTLASHIYDQYGKNVHLKVYTDETWLYEALTKYNGADGMKHGFYDFVQIDWVKTERLARATDLRAYVRSGNKELFYKDAGIKPSATIEINEQEMPLFDVVAHYLLKYPEAGDKTKKKSKVDAALTEEAAGVGIVNKQNSTCDVGPGTLRKNLDAFNLEESHMSELHAEIGEYLDGPLSGFKSHRVDSDAFGGYCVKLAHILARKHDVDQDTMQELINQYVDDALADQDSLSESSQKNITKRVQQATKGLNTYGDGEHISGDYTSYRLGMAVACANGVDPIDMKAKSWIGKKKTTHPYTKEEQAMLKQAYKAVGASYKDLNKGDLDSKELESTQSISPVAKPKRNKYGI